MEETRGRRLAGSTDGRWFIVKGTERLTPFRPACGSPVRCLAGPVRQSQATADWQPAGLGWRARGGRRIDRIGTGAEVLIKAGDRIFLLAPAGIFRL